MSVTEYLERARQCAEIAGRTAGPDKATLMKIADVWLELAHEAAKNALTTARDQPRVKKSRREAGPGPVAQGPRSRR